MHVLPKSCTSLAGAGPRSRLLLILFLLAALAIAAGCAHTSGAVPTPPLQVQVADVEQRDVPLYKEWIGTLDGLVNADIKAQVSGYLDQAGIYRRHVRQERPTTLSDRSPAIPGGAGTGGRTTGAVAGPVGTGACPVSAGGSAGCGGAGQPGPHPA